MYPFEKKIIADVGYNDYPFPFVDSKNGKPRFMKTFEVLIETRTNEILNFFETREECQKYIIENELRIYLTEESFYKSDALTVRKYGIHLNKHNTFMFEEKEDIIDFLSYEKERKMKFDYIIQNPPYNGNLHLNFLEKGLDLLTENGKMVIIEPAMWLINLNPRSDYNKGTKDNHTPDIKRRIEGHVESVVIENFNKDFGTRLYMPFAITTIDMSKSFDTIKLSCCGEKKQVKSIYDCNLIGDRTVVLSIMDKIKKSGDMMGNHTTKEKMGEGIWYAKYAELDGLDLCQLETERSGRNYDSSLNIFQRHLFGEFLTKYSTGAYHYMQNEIKNTPHFGLDSGKHLTDKITTNIYGAREELENWKHFIFNNKLPLFINIVLTVDQNKNGKPSYLPWLVDRKYTDDEINKLLDFTDEEVKLMNRTIEKYERNSPWFKRYMCGPGSVDSDLEKEEKIINDFIDKLNEKYA